MTIDARTAIALAFSKAVSFLQIRTGFYDLRDLSAEAGKRVALAWDRDV